MYIPGTRSLRSLVQTGLQPVTSLANASGLTNRLIEWRRNAARAYLSRGAHGTRPRSDAAQHFDWARWSVDHSEPGGYFFSENLVSNELDFLRAAPALQALPKGLACLGVGPEPILSYLGIYEPPLAFVVDVRRDNARLHHLYRGIFHAARSRGEWLTLLLGRSYASHRDPGHSASIHEILQSVADAPATRSSFLAAHQQALSYLDQLPPHRLPGDLWGMRRLHQQFARRGVEITFQLAGLRLRRYPTLAELVSARSASGQQLGFLACEDTFRAVQQLEKSSQIVPIVGNFACGTALKGIANILRERGMQLGALYVSNVEQYLFESDQWANWIETLSELPCHPQAIVIRSYFENARGIVPDPPATLAGQLVRTAQIALETRLSRQPLPLHTMQTVTHRLAPFLRRNQERRYQGYRELVSDQSLLCPESHS